VKRWLPKAELSKREAFLMKRLRRTRKLFAFLRLHRHELFDESFQAELESMYRKTGAGAEPVPPALLCTVLLLQAYVQASDAEAVELSIVDARWQMVLDCMGADEPPFSQGGLQQFRERLIAADLDRRLLDKTIELARGTKEFDWKKLPKDLRLAVDSRPLDGAGRVEDTFNLLGHAARKIVDCAAALLGVPREQICKRAGIPLLLHPSIKAGLDVNWSVPEEKDGAIDILQRQVTSLHEWLEKHHLHVEESVRPYVQAVAQVQAQNLEQDADGTTRIHCGVAADRRVSIEDPDMRHGRKSKTKRFNGYKQHIGVDIDTGLVAACAVTPANRPEEEATPEIEADLRRQGREVAELYIDRAYVNSEMAIRLDKAGKEILAKPWRLQNNRGLFNKGAFDINLRLKVITCPAGQVERFEPGETIEFDPEVCGPCKLREHCTMSASGTGRTIQIGEHEGLQKKLRQLQGTPSGRQRLRARVTVEHHLAHLSARQGPRARYRGCRKNLFDLRRAAAIQNLETTQRVAAG